MWKMLIVLAVALLLSACASPATQTESPASMPDSGAGSRVAPGRTVDLEPTMTSAGRTLLEQGRAQRMAGEYPQASASLERALRVEPQQPSIWLELGLLRFDEGNFAQAEQMARKALTLAPPGNAVQSQASQLVERSRRAAGR